MVRTPRNQDGIVYQTYIVVVPITSDVGHVCGTCRVVVRTDELISHAGEHLGVRLAGRGDRSVRRASHVPSGPSTVHMMTLVRGATVVHVCGRCDEEVATDQLRDHARAHVERDPSARSG